MPQADDFAVLNNDKAHQFEVQVDGSTALLTYQRLGRSLVLNHVEVPTALEGRGIASQLTRTALEFARMEHLDVVAVCPYVAGYLKKHPEYHDLLSEKNLKRLQGEPEK
jgi:predicted GNAT family acetyltransferase